MTMEDLPAPRRNQLRLWMQVMLLLLSMDLIWCQDREPLPESLSLLKQLESGGDVQPQRRQTNGGDGAFKLLSSEEIRDRLLEMEKRYPQFAQVTTSQAAFGLPAAGTSSDCTFDADIEGCANYILVLQDTVLHPFGTPSAKALPQVLWSGALHGDERVGPTTVVETAELLLQATQCESLVAQLANLKGKGNMMMMNGIMGSATRSAQKELRKRIRACKKKLESSMDIESDADRQWLARLLSTRRIVVVPSANALGYYRDTRTEDGIDPNRDFPYDVTRPQDCMNTIAGRTLNELFRRHMFQMALTYHGGVELLGYEWGNPTWGRNTKSPDDTAQEQLSAAMSRYGGSFASSPLYEYGVMNDILYAVRGGMEDWAYAASWDTSRTMTCQPTTFGGYPAHKTHYESGTCRSFNILVETSNWKTPSPDTLGSWQDVLSSTGVGNGHVPRNIRVALLATDVVQPYVVLTSVNGQNVAASVTPGVKPFNCPPQLDVADSMIRVEWQVGGSFAVDGVSLWYGDKENAPSDLLDCSTLQPATATTARSISQFLQRAPMVTDAFGAGARFGDDTMTTTFAAEIDTTSFAVGSKLVVVASARVDQDWQRKEVANLVPLGVSPQSHMVNARTNASWSFEMATATIQGRLDWFSQPSILSLQR